MKRITTVFLLVCMLLSTLAVAVPASAEYDAKAYALGYTIDLDVYNTVKWASSLTRYIYIDSVLVGTSTMDIGLARMKSKYDNDYIDVIITRTSSKGSGGKTSGWFGKNYYGYTNYIDVTAQLGNSQTLWAHDPKRAETSTTYNIGFSASVGTSKQGASGQVGVSASHSFTINCLDINDNSNPAQGLFSVDFDYNHAFWPWDWDNLDQYSYQYSDQLASFMILSPSSSYKVAMARMVSYELYDSVPSFWAVPLGTTITNTVSFTVNVK